MSDDTNRKKEQPPVPRGPDVEASTEDYARRFSGPVGSWFLEIQERLALDLLAPFAPADVLDVGGGHGQLAVPLSGKGFRVTVLGSDPVCGERLRPWLGGDNLSFVSGNVLAPPFPDRSFDVVISFRMLAHVPDWRRYVAELARVARLAVLIDFPTSRSLNALTPLLFNLKHKVEGNTRPYALFRESELAAEFAAAGFEARGRRAQYFLPMAAYRAAGSRGLAVIAEAPFRWTGLTAMFGSPVILLLVKRPSP